MLPKRFADARETTVATADAVQTILASDEYRPSYREVSLNEIDFCEEGTLEVDGEHLPYLQGVHEDLAKAAGIPLGFGYRISFDLFRTNFNALKTSQSKGLTLCMVRDTVVGVAKSNYRVAKTQDVLDRLDFTGGGWEVDRATVSDFGVNLNLIIPGVAVEPAEGDIINIGMQISNSETGNHSLRASLFTLRLECTNGAVFRTDESVVYWQSFQKRTYDASLNAFVTHLDKAKDAAESVLATVYDEVMERPVMDEHFVSLFRGLQRRVGNATAAQDILEILPEERQEIQKLVRNRDRHEDAEPTRFMTFDVHNRITAAAQHHRLLLRQSLEELGGSLLFSPPSRN